MLLENSLRIVLMTIYGVEPKVLQFCDFILCNLQVCGYVRSNCRRKVGEGVFFFLYSTSDNHVERWYKTSYMTKW